MVVRVGLCMVSGLLNWSCVQTVCYFPALVTEANTIFLLKKAKLYYKLFTGDMRNYVS